MKERVALSAVCGGASGVGYWLITSLMGSTAAELWPAIAIASAFAYYAGLTSEVLR